MRELEVGSWATFDPIYGPERVLSIDRFVLTKPVDGFAQYGMGVEVSCPRYGCDWREEHASAEVVNEYGVRDPLPSRCPVHGLLAKVDRIVEVVR